MPLFRARSRSPPPAPPPQRSGGLFSRRSDSPEHNSASMHSNSTRSGGGLFGGRRRSSSSSDSSLGSSNLKHDPSIVSARQRVTDAEAAETAADRALNLARSAVRDAKNHVRGLEKEALEDARRAKAKQAEAKTIRKSTGRLGRHGT